MKPPVRGPAPWLLVGVIGWAGVLWLGVSLWGQTPPRAGFDLALLLEAGRRVLAGESPYAPEMLAGNAPTSTSLFYSYPPPVAQAMTLFAGLPNGIALVLWGLGATIGLALAAWQISRALGRSGPGTALRTVAVAPLVLAFTIALLFGNLDAWYPLMYGALVLAVLPGASRGMLVGAGLAVATISIARLHPASLLAWIAARALLDHGGPQARVLAAALVAGALIVLASLAFGGVAPWLDYALVVRAGAGADLVDPRNLAPVSLLGQALHLDVGTLRLVQVVIAGVAVLASVLAAIRVRDPVASLAIAIAASLVLLPVTWIHYPVALIPLGLAIAIRSPASRPMVILAVVLADLAITFGPLLWVGVAVLLVAAYRAGPGTTADSTPVPVTGRTTPH